MGGVNWASFSGIWWVGGVNHLGGRWGGAGSGLSGPGNPCGERDTVFDWTQLCQVDFRSFWKGNRGVGGGHSFDVGGSAVVRTTMLG